MKLSLSNILCAVLCLLLPLGFWAARRWKWSEKLQLVCLGAVACLSLFAHAEWLHFDKERSSIQSREFYHYYLGSKFFSETGYYDLYNATALADLEDDPKRFATRVLIRDLRDHRIVRFRGKVVKMFSHVKKKFSPARWAEFKRDIKWFRDTYKDGWRLTVLFHDHGYNGSPVLHVLLGGIANHIPLSTGAAFRLLSYGDLFLVLLMGVLLWFLFDPRVGLLFLCCFGLNPFNETAFVGGAYLRYLDLLAMALCLLCLHRKRFAWAGAAMAFAISIRVFEVIWILPLLLVVLFRWRAGVEGIRQETWHFAKGAVLSGVILLTLTSALVPATKWNPWVDFADRLKVVKGKDALNTMSINNVFHYAESVKRHNWLAETKRLVHEKRWLIRAFQLLFCLLLLFFCRRCGWNEAFFVGISLIFLFLPLSHYYYYVLALVPLMFREYIYTLLLFAMFAVCVLIKIAHGTSFFSFHLQGVVLVAYLFATVLLYLKQTQEPIVSEDDPNIQSAADIAATS